MERILYTQLYEYLSANNILSEHQFGFRKFHSTATALFDCTNDLYINMDRKLFNLVVFVELKVDLLVDLIAKTKTSWNHRKCIYITQIILNWSYSKM